MSIDDLFECFNFRIKVYILNEACILFSYSYKLIDDLFEYLSVFFIFIYFK